MRDSLNLLWYDYKLIIHIYSRTTAFTNLWNVSVFASVGFQAFIQWNRLAMQILQNGYFGHVHRQYTDFHSEHTRNSRGMLK